MNLCTHTHARMHTHTTNVCTVRMCCTQNHSIYFFSDRLVAYEPISDDGMRALISSNYVYFFKQTPPSLDDVEAKIDLELLHHCRHTTSKGDKGDKGNIYPCVISLQELMCVFVTLSGVLIGMCVGVLVC